MEDAEWGGEDNGNQYQLGFLKVARSNIKKYAHKDPDEEWELLPECRKCYQIFDSRGDLDAHLELRPKDRMPFVRKTYNMLHPRARHEGDRKCLTCAAGFSYLDQVDEDFAKTGHARNGMIPRWKQDKGWTNHRGVGNIAQVVDLSCVPGNPSR